MDSSPVPLSSSPPEFTSSSPTSDLSSELGKEEGSLSLTSTTRSDTASISDTQLFDCGLHPDQFSRRLYELLLLVLRDRELERSSEETDCTTCTSPSDDSGSSRIDSGNDDKVVVANIRASTPPSQTMISKWFSDQGFVHQSSTKPSGMLSRTLNCLSDYSQSSDQGAQKDTDDDDDEVSPIQFELPKNETLHLFPNAATATTEVYRIVKRPHSSIQDEDSMPDTKRRKLEGDHSAHTHDRVFASRTASLRRADSLKSVQTTGDGKTPSQAGCVPTVPATPILVPRKTRRKASAIPLINPVPIIAPPPDHVPKLPLSAETLAKIRLGKFLGREGRGREKDGLPVSVWEMVGSDEEQEEAEVVVRKKLIDWETVLGIGQLTREEVINWILDVMPALPPDSVSSTTSSASGSFFSSRSSSSSSSTSMGRHPSDLMDQLKNCPETRFHAAWMFLRYFYLTMSPHFRNDNSRNLSRQSSLHSNISASTNQEGRDLVIWDIAVACLALSVKLGRDFLHPLLPVYAHEYLLLAPHRLSYEDLETAQRDVLSAFDYFLGVTPQPVMDELWFSLESLRSLLSFENGWKAAMADAWCGLFDAICEPDVQMFPISTLTAVALMDGVVESLAHRYLYQTTSSIFDYSASTSTTSIKTRRRPRRGSNEDSIESHALELAASNNLKMRSRKKYLRKAKRASEGVRCDIQALVGITDVGLFFFLSILSL